MAAPSTLLGTRDTDQKKLTPCLPCPGPAGEKRALLPFPLHLCGLISTS